MKQTGLKTLIAALITTVCSITGCSEEPVISTNKYTYEGKTYELTKTKQYSGFNNYDLERKKIRVIDTATNDTIQYSLFRFQGISEQPYKLVVQRNDTIFSFNDQTPEQDFTWHQFQMKLPNDVKITWLHGKSTWKKNENQESIIKNPYPTSIYVELEDIRISQLYEEFKEQAKIAEKIALYGPPSKEINQPSK